MKGLVWFLLAAFGAYVAFRYYSINVQVSQTTANNVVAPAGVNYYCNQPVTQRLAQTQAYLTCNPCMTTAPGFSAAFGPSENMPTNVARLEI